MKKLNMMLKTSQSIAAYACSCTANCVCNCSCASIPTEAIASTGAYSSDTNRTNVSNRYMVQSNNES